MSAERVDRPYLDDLIGVERRLPRAGELYLDPGDLTCLLRCVEDHRPEDDAKLVLDFSGLVAWLEDEVGSLRRRILELDTLPTPIDDASYALVGWVERSAAFGSVLRVLKGEPA